jgi:electron transfer flavoprotein beta subunit
MRILACFKSVPEDGAADANTRVINPFDAIAIEEALRLRERSEATEILAVTIGASPVEEQCRAALAMGVDRCLRVDDARQLDPYAIARILQAVVRRESPRLVLMGKQAVDDDCGQTGQILAGLLGWPQATFVSKVAVSGDRERLECTRETDSGLEVIEVRLPAVVTSDLRLNEPRYVSLPGLIKARKKPIEIVTCEQLGVSVQPRTTTLNTSVPAQRPPGTRVQSVEELVRKLRDEAKVI